jgi:transposase
MAEGLVNVDRQRPMLLPPDLRDWVAENDLVHLVMEAVELCDLSGAQLNVRGSGSEQYPPSLMMGLLIYAYATGVFSSRRIERATYDSVALRYLCANHHPDHDTIAKFRRDNAVLFGSCFAQVLLMAREAGVLRLGAVSIDGTREWRERARRRRCARWRRSSENCKESLVSYWKKLKRPMRAIRTGKERSCPKRCMIRRDANRSSWRPKP